MSTQKPGLFHQLKQHVFHGEKHVDADYETAHNKFATLNDTLHKLKADANNYVASVYSVFLNSNNVSVNFSTLLDESSNPNPYQELSQNYRQAHNKLNSERQQQVAGDLTEKVLKPLEETLKGFNNLQARIARRNELHGELEYYLNKVHELNKERDARSSKGKSESSKDIEKFERNQQKLNTSRNEYTNYTSSLIADLMNAWNARIEMLGPMLASFIQTEKTFLQIYATELSVLGQSGKLQIAPAESLHEPISSKDVPRPVVAGDVQNEPVYPNTTTSYSSMSSNDGFARQETPGVNPPPPISQPEPYHGASESTNPFDTPAVQTTQRDDPNTQNLPDSTYQTMTSQPHVPGGVGSSPIAHPTPENNQATTTAVDRPIVVDPTTVFQEQAGYTHTTTTPGMAQSNAFYVSEPAAHKNDNNGLIKSQGEEESKRQRYEEDMKVHDSGFQRIHGNAE